jgi:hypothetical protein
MKAIASSRLLFFTSVIAGGTVWAVFAVLKTEPWDSLYGWIAVAGLGLTFGFLGKGNPMFWPLGIFLGEILFGLGEFLKSIFFYSDGGVNFFFPLGLLFLIPFTVPALIGSVVGFEIRKATHRA